MNLYDLFMYPLEKRVLTDLRKKAITYAKGKVLEIGAGTGVNLRYYNANKVTALTLVDMDKDTVAAENAKMLYTFTSASATDLPFNDNSFDTVVETLVLCSVDDEPKMLQEIMRVLKKDGQFIHIDHGLPHPKVQSRLFMLAAPIWRGITRSCRLDKDQQRIVKKAGFEDQQAGYSSNGVFYWGISTITK